jgi:hypothetical protein
MSWNAMGGLRVEVRGWSWAEGMGVGRSERGHWGGKYFIWSYNNKWNG